MIYEIYNLSSKVFRNRFNLKYTCSRYLSTKNSYKVLFFGSNDIALDSLRKINELRKSEKNIDRLDLVTANNSKKKFEIEKYAQKEKINTLLWPLQNIQRAEYDIGLIVSFGHLIRDEVLNKFPLGMINVHPSLLPRWRGAAPIIHTLLHGDQITGVTLMKIKPNIFDVGDIISQRKVSVSKDIRLPELTEHLSEIGAEMLVECMYKLPECLANALPQPEEGVTYAKKIDKRISEVRWVDMCAIEVYNLYRAIYGLYPLRTKFRQKEIKLFGAFVENSDVEQEKGDKQVGLLEYSEKTNSIRILCKDKRYIHFKSVRIVGKREISALDFYNGYIKNMPVDKRNCIVC